jgi:outer membrane lipoprotein-sorting protein
MNVVPPSDDPLDHAEEALRRTLIPDGPPQETISRTLAALNAKTFSSATPFLSSTTVKSALKVAAAVLVAAGGVLYFALAPTAKATTAFAELAQKLRNAHTLSHRMTIEGPDLKTTFKGRYFFKEPKLMRNELDGGVVSILDGARAKQLILDPAAKSALLIESKAPEPAAAAPAAGGLIESLRQLTEGDAKAVGEKVIGTVRARGYLVNKLGVEMTIWVDPGTRLPLRIECLDHSQGKEFRMTLTDFQIDPVLDDALFSLDLPAGYALRKEESNIFGMDDKTFLDPEKAASDLLRLFAEKAGGAFPKRLDDASEYQKLLPKQADQSKLPSGEMLKVLHSYTRFVMAIRTLKAGFGYRSEGVKLGDADKIVFWYRPEGAANYRAIYGDLHAGEVAEDKLPEKPKP